MQPVKKILELRQLQGISEQYNMYLNKVKLNSFDSHLFTEVTCMYFSVTIMLTLQTTVAVCTVARHTGKLCMGAVGRHRRQPATLTVYTREGAVEAQHLEHRCTVCGTGYWHGYYTQVLEHCTTFTRHKNIVPSS